MIPSYKTRAVVFLDVLGTKCRTSFEDKHSVHRLFHEEINRNAERQAQLPHVAYSRELRSFSDCVYTFYSFKEGIEERRKDELHLLYTCLYNTSISILRILSAGYLVRGGATLGDCFIDQLGFFGPAVEEAYHIESKRAVYPRVMLSDETGSRLAQWESDRDPGEVLKSMFTSLPSLVLRDDEGHWFLNTFFELERTQVLHYGDQEFTLQDMKDRVYKTIKSEETRNPDDPRVLEKLSWMKSFTDQSQVKLNPEVGAGTIILGE